MTTTVTHPYNITLEEAGPARKRVNITVPAETISTKIKESMGVMMSQTVIPGFRKGKVPTHLLEKRFGESIRSEARNELISDAWKSALEEFELRTLGEPEPVGDPEDVVLVEGKELSFSLEVEVMPDFELPAFDDIQLTRPAIEVTDTHVDEEIDRQKIRHGNLEDVDGKSTEGDFLLSNAVVHLDGKDETFYEDKQNRITVPPKGEGGQVLGLHIENLSDLTSGVSAGDEITIETTGPDEHELEDVRGASVVITLHVSKVVRIEALSIEELLSAFGLETEESLKEQVLLALEQRRDKDQTDVLRRQATEEIANRVEMDLPEKTSALQAERDLQRLRTELQSSGRMTMEEVEAEVAKVRSGSAEQSKKRLKTFFILTKLAEHFHVTVNEMEINARIAEIAMQNGQRPEEMHKQLTQQGQMNQIQAVIREDKAADQLVAACTVTDMPAEEWQKLQAGTSTDASKKTAKKKASKKKTTKKKTTKKSPSKS